MKEKELVYEYSIQIDPMDLDHFGNATVTRCLCSGENEYIVQNDGTSLFVQLPTQNDGLALTMLNKSLLELGSLMATRMGFGFKEMEYREDE